MHEIYKIEKMEIYKNSEITVNQLNELREEDRKIQILDIREDTERNHAHINKSIHSFFISNLR